MVERLIETVLGLAASTAGDRDVTGDADVLQGATKDDWKIALATLRLHRLAPLAWHGIHAHGLADAPPPEYKKAFQEEHRNTLLFNGALLHALAESLDALREHGVDPILWKGVVLASCFYPNIAMRPMDDIDMAIEKNEIETVTAAFKSIGYEIVSTIPYALYFRNSTGITFDVHHRVELFEGHEPDTILTTMRSPHLGDRDLKVLSGEAMLTHLTDHAEGHRGTMGYTLRWIADLHFVMRGYPDGLSMEVLWKLLPSAEESLLFLRFVRFLETYMGTVAPDSLRDRLDGVPPLSLSEVLRSRRLALWGLPAPRGFAHLVFRRDLATLGEKRDLPQASDLLLWPMDYVRERRATAAAKRVWKRP